MSIPKRDELEVFARMSFPPETDARLQYLMDRNTKGYLITLEHEELELDEHDELLTVVLLKVIAPVWAIALPFKVAPPPGNVTVV